MTTEGLPEDRRPDDELDQETVDRRWSQLVADFAMPAIDPPHEVAAEPEVAADSPADPAQEPSAAPSPASPEPPSTVSQVVPWRQHLPPDDDVVGDQIAADDDEAHYEPPEPPPLPRGDAAARFAWAGLLGGPVLLFLAAVLGIGPSPWTALLGTGGFVGGFVTLIVRMRDDRDDDGHNGAVV